MAHKDEIRAEISDLYPRLWRYCLVITSNQDRANDLAQAAYKRGLEKDVHFQSGTNLDRWLFRIARRLWYNEMRADVVRRGGGLTTLDDIELTIPSPDSESNYFTGEVLASVMKLPEAQRLTVLLVYLEGYSYREAADSLDIPIGTVMSRLSVARSRLCNELFETFSSFYLHPRRQ